SDVIVQFTGMLRAQRGCLLGCVESCDPIDAVVERLTEHQGHVWLFTGASSIALIVGTRSQTMDFLGSDQVAYAVYAAWTVQCRAAIQNDCQAADGDVRQ